MAGRELQQFFRDRALQWTLRGNYALAADYTIRALNQRADDPLSLVLGHISGTRTRQQEFVTRCEDRLVQVSKRRGVVEGNLWDLAEIHPHKDTLQPIWRDAVGNASSSANEVEEVLEVRESESFEATAQAVLKAAAQVSREPLVTLLEPKHSPSGRGLFAQRRVARHDVVLSDQPVLAMRMSDESCAHCLKRLDKTADTAVDNTDSGFGGAGTPCPFCQRESYCSSSCRDVAWRSYHACLCPSVNPTYAAWESRMREQLMGDENDGGSDSRAALTCLAIGKICGMSTVLQMHPLSLPGIAALRGTATYDPCTALGQVGSMAVSLATALRQTHLYMEDIIALFGILQTNEFLLGNAGMALYPLLSLVNHSCEPNCVIVGPTRHSSVQADTKQLIAIQDIRDGEQLTIDYNYSMTSTLSYTERRALLAQRHFECFCPRWESLFALARYSDIEASAVLKYAEPLRAVTAGCGSPPSHHWLSNPFSDGGGGGGEAGRVSLEVSRDTLLLTGGVIPLSCRHQMARGTALKVLLTHFNVEYRQQLHRYVQQRDSTASANLATNPPLIPRAVVEQVVAAIVENAHTLRFDEIADEVIVFMGFLPPRFPHTFGLASTAHGGPALSLSAAIPHHPSADSSDTFYIEDFFAALKLTRFVALQAGSVEAGPSSSHGSSSRKVPSESADQRLLGVRLMLHFLSSLATTAELGGGAAVANPAAVRSSAGGSQFLLPVSLLQSALRELLLIHTSESAFVPSIAVAHALQRQVEQLHGTLDATLQQNANAENPLRLGFKYIPSADNTDSTHSWVSTRDVEDEEADLRFMSRLSLIRCRRIALLDKPDEFIQEIIPVVEKCPPSVYVELELIEAKIGLLSLLTGNIESCEAVYDDLLQSLRALVELAPKKRSSSSSGGGGQNEALRRSRVSGDRAVPTSIIASDFTLDDVFLLAAEVNSEAERHWGTPAQHSTGTSAPPESMERERSRGAGVAQRGAFATPIWMPFTRKHTPLPSSTFLLTSESQVLQHAHTLVVSILCGSAEITSQETLPDDDVSREQAEQRHRSRLDQVYTLLVTHKYHGVSLTQELLLPMLEQMAKAGDGRAFNLVDQCVLYCNNKIDLTAMALLFVTCAKAGDHHRARALFSLLRDVVPGFLVKSPPEVMQSLRTLKVLDDVSVHAFASAWEAPPVEVAPAVSGSSHAQTTAQPRQRPAEAKQRGHSGTATESSRVSPTKAVSASQVKHGNDTLASMLMIDALDEELDTINTNPDIPAESA